MGLSLCVCVCVVAMGDCTLWCRYLDNVIDHPGEEKYRKIRVGNKTFAVRD